MTDLEWLQDELVRVLRWEMKHPGGVNDPRRPQVPLAGHRVWSIFLALNARRGAGFSGPLPLSMAEVEAYARVRREPLRPFELDMIEALDDAYMAAARDKATETSVPQVTEPASSEKILAAFRMAAGPTR